MDFQHEEPSIFSAYYQAEYERRHTDYRPHERIPTGLDEGLVPYLIRTISQGGIAALYQLVRSLWAAGPIGFHVGIPLAIVLMIALAVLPVIDYRKLFREVAEKYVLAYFSPLRLGCKALSRGFRRLWNWLVLFRQGWKQVLPHMGNSLLWLYYNTRYNVVTDRAYLYWQRFVFAIEDNFWWACFLAVLSGYVCAAMMPSIPPRLRPSSLIVEAWGYIHQDPQSVDKWQWFQEEVPDVEPGLIAKSITIYDKPFEVWLSAQDLADRDDQPWDVLIPKKRSLDRPIEYDPAVITTSPRPADGKSAREEGHMAVSTGLAWCGMCQQLHWHEVVL